jgi:hypothetical protein
MLTFAKSSTTAVMLTNARKAAGAQLLQIDYSLRRLTTLCTIRGSFRDSEDADCDSA